MPTFYNFTQDGLVYKFDDIFIPVDFFTQGNLWSWGYNGNGQLGDNTAANKITPVTVLYGETTWKQVSGGYAHTAAIKTDGTLWTWGQNTFGQLGDNTNISKSTPVTTFAGGTNWRQVSTSGIYTVAIKTDGTLWIWGSNISGRRSTPVTTFAGGTTWKQVSASGANDIDCTSAIKTDGTLWVWGRNDFAQLGTNDDINRSTPVTTFAGGTTWKQVSGGDSHMSAIKTDGTLWTWGYNIDGPLGNNTITPSSTPVTTFSGGTTWKQVECGDFCTLAVKTDGTLWTWGSNGNGQLGDNTFTTRSTPVTTFAGGTTWKQVSGGFAHTLVIQIVDSVI